MENKMENKNNPEKPKSSGSATPLFSFAKPDAAAKPDTAPAANPESKSSFFSFFKKKPKNDTPSPAQTEDMVIEKVEEKKYAKPSVEVSPSDKILENIVSRETAQELPKLVFGPKPNKNTNEIIRFGVENKLKVAKTFFQIVVVLAILSAVFFKVELDTNFHLLEEYLDFPTAANNLTNVTAELLTTKTNINFYNTALTRFYIDKFVYLYNYRGMTVPKSEDVQELAQSLAIVKAKVNTPWYTDNIPILYTHITLPVDAAGTPPPLDTYLGDIYEQTLLASITQQKESLRQKIPADGSEESYTEIRIMESLPVLVEKKDFLATSLSEYDPETLTTASVKKLVKAFNDISKNDYAVISSIKNKRISWTQNLTNIENITKKVDFYFGEPGVMDLAKVFYRSYAFDADKNTITVNGEVRTDNVMVFSELIELIEAFQTAPEFKLTNEIRKFAKSEQEDKYITQFQFVLFINPAVEIPAETLIETTVEAPADTTDTQKDVVTSDDSPLSISEDTASGSNSISNESMLPEVEQPTFN